MRSGAQFRLPDFVGIGPERTGTTWLHNTLTDHVGVPRQIKKVHFFDQNYTRGLAWYARYFEGFPLSTPVGEITPAIFVPRRAANG